MNFLKRLFSKSVKEQLVELPPEFVQADPPDWLIDLKGASLAHGNHFSIRVQLINASRAGTVDVVIMPRKEGEFPRSDTLALPQLLADKLFVILGFSFPDDITSIATPAKDVLPIDLTIYRREPYLLSTATFSLSGAWLESRKTGPPVIEISRILLAVAEPTLQSETETTP